MKPTKGYIVIICVVLLSVLCSIYGCGTAKQSGTPNTSCYPKKGGKYVFVLFKKQ